MAENEAYRVMIVEDEAPARELLVDCIAARSELRLAGVARDGKEALEKLAPGGYDLLFLDVDLPFLSGIEVLEKLASPPHVIFTTGYDRYAIRAFDVGAVDYLLKPYTAERFNQAVDKFIAMKGEGGGASPGKNLGLSFREEGKHYLLSYDDIIYLSSHGKHTIIHTEERDFETPSVLKNIEPRLDPSLFVRIHKQYVANLRFVSHIQYVMGGQYQAHFKDRDETSLPVGRAFAPALKQFLSIK